MHRAISFLALLVPGLLAAAPLSDEPLRTAADRVIDIHHIRLDLQVDLPKKTVDGRATILFRTLRSLHNFTLDAVDFQILDVQLQRDGKKTDVHFDHDGKLITIDFNSLWKENTEGTLVVNYRVHDPKEGLHFFGPTPAEPDVPLTVWSDGQPTDNRYWFPRANAPTHPLWIAQFFQAGNHREENGLTTQE